MSTFPLIAVFTKYETCHPITRFVAHKCVASGQGKFLGLKRKRAIDLWNGKSVVKFLWKVKINKYGLQISYKLRHLNLQFNIINDCKIGKRTGFVHKFTIYFAKSQHTILDILFCVFIYYRCTQHVFCRIFEIISFVNYYFMISQYRNVLQTQNGFHALMLKCVANP